MKKIVLIGAGGHCKVIVDIINNTGEYEIVGITDKNVSNKFVFDIPILGDDNILKELYNKGVHYAFICLGAINNMKIRNRIYNNLIQLGFETPVIIHKRAVVSSYVKIGQGTCIMAGAIINPGTVIGENCIINTGSIVEHDCMIGNNTHIAPRSAVAGGVSIGENSHIGIGSSIIQGLNIGRNVTVGAGGVVINDLPDNTVAVGIPAKIIRSKKSQ